jgi:sulfur-oxidizing protein SoxA
LTRLRVFTAALALCSAAASVQSQVQPSTDPRRSGFQDMSAATQALQSSDSQNPAFLWVKGGEDSFARDCKGCHDVASMRGVATRYPAFDTASARPITLSGRIQQCRQQRARLEALPPEHDELLGLEAFVALQSRGLPIAPPQDSRLDAARAQGQLLWQQRLGQLGLSCAQCHDHNAGGRLAGSVIPQGHATGYPLYRLEWQGLGSLQRRLRNCMTGVRAAAFAYGSPEFTALELHLKQRAARMPMDAPAVRP